MLKIDENVELTKYTTLGVGGLADYLIIVKNQKELTDSLNYAQNKRLPFKIIGKGSNLLISDNGFRGLIIVNRSDSWERKGECVKAESGATIAKIAIETLKDGFLGLDFATGIPGTVGAAVVGNVGLPSRCISNVLVSISVWDNGQIKNMDNKDLSFDYRYSILKKHNNTVVISVKLKLNLGNTEEALNGVRIDKKRRALNYVGRTAGSYFKNPESGESAAELIDSLGLKGYSIGGAEISPNHANVFRNIGRATAKDFYLLEQYVIKEINNKYGIVLEPEVVKLGKF